MVPEIVGASLAWAWDRYGDMPYIVDWPEYQQSGQKIYSTRLSYIYCDKTAKSSEGTLFTSSALMRLTNLLTVILL